MSRPLILDVDGTLIKSDLTHEMILAAILRDPWRALRYLRLGLTDKPQMKQEMVARIGDRLAVDVVPLESEIIGLAQEAVASGRNVHLCSGSEQSLVDRLGERLDFVSETYGTSPTYNMTSGNKAAFLEDRFPNGFDYAGNSTQDYAVWEAAQLGYGVRPPSDTEHTRTAADLPVEILVDRPTLSEKLPAALWGFEIWTVPAILVPVLIVCVLIGMQGLDMLALSLGIAALLLAGNVECMLRNVQDDRRRGGLRLRDNPVASGDLSVPLALFAYLALGTAGLFLLATLTPWLAVLVVSIRVLVALFRRVPRTQSV
ncbi:MAG: hypothetical protein AAF311_10745 [Pseudomonadota bacterium]